MITNKSVRFATFGNFLIVSAHKQNMIYFHFIAIFCIKAVFLYADEKIIHSTVFPSDGKWFEMQ